jgi:hypothetical protein
MKLHITAAELDVLEAAATGDICRPATVDGWLHVNGTNVSRQAWALIQRGLLTETEPTAGVVFATPTQEGRDVLTEIADRGPNRD